MKLILAAKKFKELVSKVTAERSALVPAAYAVKSRIANDISLKDSKPDQYGRHTLKIEGETIFAGLMRGAKEGLEAYDLALCESTREIKVESTGTTYPKGTPAFRLVEPE